MSETSKLFWNQCIALKLIIYKYTYLISYHEYIVACLLRLVSWFGYLLWKSHHRLSPGSCSACLWSSGLLPQPPDTSQSCPGMLFCPASALSWESWRWHRTSCTPICPRVGEWSSYLPTCQGRVCWHCGTHQKHLFGQEYRKVDLSEVQYTIPTTVECCRFQHQGILYHGRGVLATEL